MKQNKKLLSVSLCDILSNRKLLRTHSASFSCAYRMENLRWHEDWRFSFKLSNRSYIVEIVNSFINNRFKIILLPILEATAVLMQKCIDENVAKEIDQDENASKFSELTEKHEKLKNRYDALLKQCERRLWQANILSGFLFAIKELDMLQLDCGGGI